MNGANLPAMPWTQPEIRGALSEFICKKTAMGRLHARSWVAAWDRRRII
jgi:hypothetical protein